MPTLLLLGANSDIGKACAIRFAAAGYKLILTSREETLPLATAFAANLQQEHGIEATCLVFDALQIDSHRNFYESLPALPDVVLSAIGFLGEPTNTPVDSAESMSVLNTNLVGMVSILDHIARGMQTRGSGHIIGISSVAGERGRASNYHYGSAKAGFTAYLSGLRQALSASGIQVCTILPGFVSTKMLGDRVTPPFLTTTPEKLAGRIFTAYKNQQSVVYYQPIWRIIMWIIRHIPEPIFKRLSL